MCYNIKKVSFLFLICSLALTNNYNHPTNEQWEEILNEVASIIWHQAMDAKSTVNQILPHIREDYIENLCSSAPRIDFIAHADISDSLTSMGLEANVYVSTNNQESWTTNNDVYPLGITGYETTWEAITQTNGNDEKNI